MLLYKDFIFHTTEKYQLEASLYQPTGTPLNQTIIYLHGGGLIWGSRFDLPEEYIQLFLSAGYHFLTLDYPLAPEVELPEIEAAIQTGINWFLNQANQSLELKSNEFILFGRSAGAYLGFLYQKNVLAVQPKKFISFYGYHSINEAFYLRPSSFYLRYPKISEETKKALIQTKPLVSGPLETRYAIYMYARQTGRWIDLILQHQQNYSNYSLTNEELKMLPPTFIAQSTADQDVPYSIGAYLNQHILNKEFITIEGLAHDFDKDPNLKEAQMTYQKLIEWLSKD